MQLVVLVEDQRTARFFRRLLEHLGFDPRKVRLEIAPAGEGAAEAWVRKRYPADVQYLRSKNYQRRGLIAVRDGDSEGPAQRQREMDEELRLAGQRTRDASEPIALPVPTWSIENWLLQLLGQHGINEKRTTTTDRTWKYHYEQEWLDERAALRTATSQWSPPRPEELPSLQDGRRELARIRGD